MQKTLVGGVVVVVIGGIYAVHASRQGAVQMQTDQVAREEKVLMEKAEMEKAELMAKEEAEMEKVEMNEEGMMDKEDTMIKSDESMTEEDVMKKEDQTMSGEDMMKKVGLYAPYESSKLAMANSGDVVLFFKASWCPSCRTLDTNIKASLDMIPADLTILELDYDTATALKQQYSVTTQHTLVQVDANGTLVKKWSGGSTLASIIEQVE